MEQHVKTVLAEFPLDPKVMNFLRPATRRFSTTQKLRDIGFTLNQDQKDLQELARKFTAEYIIPKVKIINLGSVSRPNG
jgi:hypothetical protein